MPTMNDLDDSDSKPASGASGGLWDSVRRGVERATGADDDGASSTRAIVIVAAIAGVAYLATRRRRRARRARR